LIKRFENDPPITLLKAAGKPKEMEFAGWEIISRISLAIHWN